MDQAWVPEHSGMSLSKHWWTAEQTGAPAERGSYPESQWTRGSCLFAQGPIVLFLKSAPGRVNYL